MRILFFTPTVLASAIGRVSSLVVQELLLSGHEVIVVRAEAPALFESPTHIFSCQMIPWDNAVQVRNLATRVELAVYQIGDNYQYHCGCLEWLPSIPGLVSMHDNFLGSLFWSWSERLGRQNALEFLKILYGEDIAHRFFDHADSTSFIAYASESSPMTEWIALKATAVIVHSDWAMSSRIIRVCPGPVEVVPLPYDAPFFGVGEFKNQPKNSERTVVLTIGHVNHNKRHASVIEAIGSSVFLRSNLSFRIVGAIEPTMEKELRLLADQLGVTIVITGRVDDQCLAEEIHSADIVCCLRWPALEAASGSTIEAMLYGKITVVTNTGFYRDLPDDCVVKISMEAELADLRAALEKLVASPTERKMIGEMARHYAVKTFRADNYAERIINMKYRIDRSNVVGAAAQVFSRTLKRWGAQGDLGIMKAITSPLELFKVPYRGSVNPSPLGEGR